MSRQRSVRQQEECGVFKRECDSDIDCISGEDWCAIPYTQYIRKNTLYEGQSNCFDILSLIESWEGGLNYFKEQMPAPQWPTDPYTRQTISIPKIVEIVDRYKTLAVDEPLVPFERLQTVYDSLIDNPAEWEEVLQNTETEKTRRRRENYAGSLPLPVEQRLFDLFYQSGQLDTASNAQEQMEESYFYDSFLRNNPNSLVLTLIAVPIGSVLFTGEDDPRLISEIDDIAVSTPFIRLMNDIYDEMSHDRSPDILPLKNYLTTKFTQDLSLTSQQREKIFQELDTWIRLALSIKKDHVSGENIYFVTQVLLQLKPKLLRFYNFHLSQSQKAYQIILQSFYQTLQIPNWQLFNAFIGPYVDIEQTLVNLTRERLIDSRNRNRLELILRETFQEVLQELQTR